MIDYVQRTGALLKDKKAMFALTLCEQGLGENSKDAAAIYSNKGVALLYLGKFEESLAAFDKACELDPNDADAHYNRSMAIRSMEHHEEALQNYLDTYEKFPTHFYNLINCGNVLRRLGRYDDSIRVYSEGLQIKKDSWELLYNRACVYILKEEYNKALEDINTALSINSNFGELYYCKAICLKNIGDLNGCKEAYAIAEKYKPEDDRPPHGWGSHPENLEAPHGPCMRNEIIKGI